MDVPPCKVCNMHAAKYRCPACDKRTCSLACVKVHKQQDGCTGSRHARPLPKSRVDVVADAAFLDSCPVANISPHLAAACSDDKGRQRRKEKLLEACKQRGIDLQLLPDMFKKSGENKSRVENDTIIWTVSVNGELREMSEHENIMNHLKNNEQVMVKLDRPTRWKPVHADHTLTSVLRGECIIEFPELKTIEIK